MTLTTSVVNAHALSHLFDDDLSSIEVCDSCDECLISSNDVYIASMFSYEDMTSALPPYLDLFIPSYTQVPVLILKSGQYFNKPPPFKLV
jgi:hypothetical protein